MTRGTDRKHPAAAKYEGVPADNAGMLRYAKAFVAVAGAGVTAALGLIPPDNASWGTLTVIAAVLTAAGVYLVPNKGM